MKKQLTQVILASTSLVLFYACVKDRNFDIPKSNCEEVISANTTYTEVKKLYTDETIQILEDLIIEGYVSSSDQAGNFFSVLHFQDSPIKPTGGFRIEIDIRESHLFYPVGSNIYIKLKGLYLGKSKEVFRLGGTFTSFGNVTVGRLPAVTVDQHIFVSCEELATLQPTQVSISELEKDLTNTLVQFEDVQILAEELEAPFAIEREETERTLMDCHNNEVSLLNSGFSDFQTEILPNGNGKITGVLLREKDAFKIAIRSLEDIDFSRARCEEIGDETTARNIFISELADPDNNPKARFVELFNGSNESLSLKGWSLRRYTNDKTELSSIIDLSALTIEGQSALVISPNAEEFETVYGFAADLGVGINSPADSNGDDNLELVDPFGTIVDVFGIVGEDGSGTNHEFEDGKAVRKAVINEANTIYTSSEWSIFNDTGAEDTTKEPQNAPEDFTPGIRD